MDPGVRNRFVTRLVKMADGVCIPASANVDVVMVALSVIPLYADGHAKMAAHVQKTTHAHAQTDIEGAGVTRKTNQRANVKLHV